MLVKQWLMFYICTAVRAQRSQETSQLPVLGLCVHVECLLWVSIFLTKQRQYIFHMLLVVTYHGVHYKLSSG